MCWVTAAQGSWSLPNRFWDYSLEPWLLARTQPILHAAAAVGVREILRGAPHAIAEGRYKQRPLWPNGLQEGIDYGLRAAVYWTQRAQGTVHHYGVARMNTEVFEVADQLGARYHAGSPD